MTNDYVLVFMDIIALISISSSFLNIHTIKDYIIDMLHSNQHQKLYFYHLPTQGRAGIKLRGC